MLPVQYLSMMKIYTYYIDDVIVHYPDNTYDTIGTENVISIVIENDYDELIMPLINLKFSTTRDIKKKIMKYKDNVKIEIGLKVRMGNLTENTTQSKEEENNFYTYVIKGLFNMMSDEAEFDQAGDLYNHKQNQGNGEPEQGAGYQNFLVNIYLFKENILTINKKFNNLIFKNVTVADVISYMAYKCGISKFLFQQPDNKTLYPHIIVPDHTFETIVEGIHKAYGIYNSGHVLYYDLDKTYLISKNPEEIIKTDGEVNLINLYMGEINGAHQITPGSFVDAQKGMYFINCINPPIIQSSGQFLKQSSYGTLYGINTITNDKTQNNITIDGYSWDSPMLVDNRYNNSYDMNSKLFDIAENNFNLKFQTSYIDVRELTPNKPVKVQYDISDYPSQVKWNGLYRIYKWNAEFVKSTKNQLKSNVNVFIKSRAQNKDSE